jgi:UDP-N-acetyl-D-mannosaminouronate:lipid I N-acetyl-D-mannosaminouronosyltransferase
MRTQKKIHGLKIYAFQSKNEVIETIKNKNVILISAGAESIMRGDNRFNKIAENHIAYPDGIGAVMALKQKGISVIKIPGAELWLDILDNMPHKKVYLFGSSDDVIEQTVAKLGKDKPDIQIVGYRNGYFTEEEFPAIKEEIVAINPDIVLIALGQPKQEYIAEELYNMHPALYMGLGGSFDVHCGLKKRAPQLFIDLNLEWFYRLLTEPRRIGRQAVLVKFLFLFFLNKL